MVSELLYDSAKLYYLDGMSQENIAAKLKISRSQVSRNLKKAREFGLVEVKLNPPKKMEYNELAAKIVSRFGLKEIIIAPLEKYSLPTDEDIIKTISQAGARYLEKLIPAHAVAGIGWGRTVYSTILSMAQRRNAENTTFIPLIGGAGQAEPWYQVNTLVDRITEKLGGKVSFLNEPAVVTGKPAPATQEGSSVLSQTERMWELVDLAIVGLGTAIRYSPVLASEMDPKLIVRFLNMETVGDILARFFDCKGNICNDGSEALITGMNIASLKRIENVVCLSGGEKKIKGIAAAAANGFINILITDSWSAQKILEMADICY
jgi:DNA-binding transcriptional regulator LsrR (DeoR family)